MWKFPNEFLANYVFLSHRCTSFPSLHKCILQSAQIKLLSNIKWDRSQINNKQFQNKHLENERSGEGKRMKIRKEYFSVFHFLTIRRMRKLLFSYTPNKHSSVAMWQLEMEKKWKSFLNLHKILCQAQAQCEKERNSTSNYVIFALSSISRLVYWLLLSISEMKEENFVVFVVAFKRNTSYCHGDDVCCMHAIFLNSFFTSPVQNRHSTNIGSDFNQIMYTKFGIQSTKRAV